MHSAVDIGVVLLVVLRDAVDHRGRLLGGGRVVQIDQRLPMDEGFQDGEVLAELPHVVGGMGMEAGRHAPPAIRARHPPTCDRTASVLTVSMISLANAWIKRRRASARPMPRERR